MRNALLSSKGLKLAVAAGVALVAGLSMAQATPLTLNINGTAVLDGGGLDTQGGTPGWVAYSSPVGGMSVVGVNGLGAPAVGTAPDAEMDISAVLFGTGTGFYVSLSDKGYSGAYQVTSHIGGTTAGTLIAYDVYVNGSLVPGLSLGSYGGPSFSGDASDTLSLGAGDTLEMVVTITHDGAPKLTSYDAWLKLTPVPDAGSTMALLGAGMLGLRYLPRRRSVVA